MTVLLSDNSVIYALRGPEWFLATLVSEPELSDGLLDWDWLNREFVGVLVLDQECEPLLMK